MATQANKAMVSEVYICNQALSWAGAIRITSLDGRSDEAEWCRDNYEFIRDAVLEERMWTFATARTISTSEDLDDWDQYYRHSVPLEWLSVRGVFTDAEYTVPDYWRREGQYILAEDTTLYLWGLKRVVNTAQFSNMFIQALVTRLAAEMSVPLTGDTKKAAYYNALYEKRLQEAAILDGMQGTGDELPMNDLVVVRR